MYCLRCWIFFHSCLHYISSMNFWSNTIAALVAILENPDSQKAYKDLKKCYEDAKMEQEVNAIDHLIETKFNNVTNNLNSDSQQ